LIKYQLNHVNQHFQNFYTTTITNTNISSQPSSIRNTFLEGSALTDSVVQLQGQLGSRRE
ncbi:MAG: hypothetical protein ACKPKO_25850, partial [Candidatus Fonsibacter sp.]